MTVIDVDALDREVVVDEPSLDQQYKFINLMPDGLHERVENENLNEDDVAWMKNVVATITKITMNEIENMSMREFSDFAELVTREAFPDIGDDTKDVSASMTVYLYEDGETRITNYARFD